MRTISATELARNTRAILDMVAGGGEIVMVERNRTVIARMNENSMQRKKPTPIYCK